MFQIGDKVKYTRSNSTLFNREGVVVEIDPSHGHTIYTVEFPLSCKVFCLEENLELLLELPHGHQEFLGDPKTCDCGGYKVYGSMASPFHDKWCTSLK